MKRRTRKPRTVIEVGADLVKAKDDLRYFSIRLAVFLIGLCATAIYTAQSDTNYRVLLASLYFWGYTYILLGVAFYIFRMFRNALSEFTALEGFTQGCLSALFSVLGTVFIRFVIFMLLLALVSATTDYILSTLAPGLRSMTSEDTFAIGGIVIALATFAYYILRIVRALKLRKKWSSEVKRLEAIHAQYEPYYREAEKQLKEQKDRKSWEKLKQQRRAAEMRKHTQSLPDSESETGPQ